MRHQWKGTDTCVRCGCHKKTTPRMMLRPVFGNRIARDTVYWQHGVKHYWLPPCEEKTE